MSKQILSIEAGVWWSKVALVDYGKKNPPVHEAFAFRTPEHAVEDGYIRDKDSFADALREELAKRNIRERDVIFTLSSSKVVTREVVIPNVKDSKIDGIIHSQIHDYFPMDVSDYTVTHSKMDVFEENGKKQIKLLLIAIPDNLLSNYCTFAQLVGLKVETFDYIGNGTVQLLGDSMQESALIVQLEEQATVISILENKKLMFQRVTPYGYGATLSAVTEHAALGVENEYDAFDFLLEHDVLFGKPDGDDPVLAEAYEDMSEALRYHLRIANTAMEYYQNQVQRDFSGTICLVGDGSRFLGMHRLFEQELPLAVQELDFSKVINLKSTRGKASTGQQPAAKKPRAATPVGFLSVIGAAVHPLDAKPKELQEASSKKNDVRTAKLIFVAAVLLAVVLVLCGSLRELAAVSEQTRLSERLSELSYVQETYDEKTVVQNEEQVYEQLDNQTVTKNEQLLSLIGQLEAAMPQTVTVQSIQTDATLVTLNLVTDEKITVGQMLLNFADVTLLTDLSIPSISENEDEDGTITWSYTVNGYYTDTELTEDTENSSEGGGETNE